MFNRTSSQGSKAALIMACVSGSRLYGTDRPDSDVDVRGVCHQPVESLIGLTPFEQQMGKPAEEMAFAELGVESNDVTFYGVTKFFRLCLGGNPNILEMLFVPASKMLWSTSAWEKIVANRHVFLSKKVARTFGGYAMSQLKKMERHHRWLNEPPTKPEPENYGAASVDGGLVWGRVNADTVMECIGRNTDASGDIWWAACREELGMLFNGAERKKEYESLLSDYKSYQTWLKNRNPARAKLEAKYGYDTKHAMHLYRLIGEGIELLVNGRLVFPLPHLDMETCLDVLNGEVSYEEVKANGKTAIEQLDRAAKYSALPDKPDFASAQKLLMEINGLST